MYEMRDIIYTLKKQLRDDLIAMGIKATSEGIPSIAKYPRLLGVYKYRVLIRNKYGRFEVKNYYHLSKLETIVINNEVLYSIVFNGFKTDKDLENFLNHR